VSTLEKKHLAYGTRECQCASCGVYFVGVTYFDMHRDGTMDARRCLTVRQMRERGMVQDGKGRWGLAAEERGAGAD
jgi:hypothetical protein